MAGGEHRVLSAAAVPDRPWTRLARTAQPSAAWWAGVCLGALAIAAHAQPPSVREQVHAAAPAARNQSLGQWLAGHGQACAVSESAFSGTFKTPRLAGDLWSVRCTAGPTFAVLIGADAASTAWFLPCETVERWSSRRCFDNKTNTETMR